MNVMCCYWYIKEVTMAFSGIDDSNSYDFEAKIQIARILKILNDTIKNCEVAVSNNCYIVTYWVDQNQILSSSLALNFQSIGLQVYQLIIASL